MGAAGPEGLRTDPGRSAHETGGRYGPHSACSLLSTPHVLGIEKVFVYFIQINLKTQGNPISRQSHIQRNIIQESKKF